MDSFSDEKSDDEESDVGKSASEKTTLLEPLSTQQAFSIWYENISQACVDHKQSQEQQNKIKEQIAHLEQQQAIEEKGAQQINDEFTELNNQYQQYQQGLIGLTSERQQLCQGKAVNEIRTDISQTREKLALAISQKQKVLANVKQVQQELSGQLTTNKLQIEELSEQLEQAKQHWHKALSASVFNGETDFKAALLSSEQKQQLTLLAQQIKEQQQGAQLLITEHQQQRERLQKELQRLVDSGLAVLFDDQALAEQTSKYQISKDQIYNDGICEDYINEQLNQTNQSLKQMQMQMGQLEQTLEVDIKQRDKQRSFIEKIHCQQQVVDDFSYLNGLIGSASGDKFRRFAQGLTLQHLVYLANVQLERLHARYQLQCNQHEGLALQVIDTWQADSIRDTKTLSGGESFLVSLSLALALSELASAKTSIDSLFLDEGFGTLDNDTLEVALDALDNLNASGKMIGVISHVDTLKERIAVQIKVHKKSGLGVSELDKRYRFEP